MVPARHTFGRRQLLRRRRYRHGEHGTLLPDLQMRDIAPTRLCGLPLRLQFARDVGDLPGWSINWDVVLQPNMKVLTSNHQRAAREDGRDHLIWCFDGNKTSSANVDFTVRVLKIR